VENFLEENVMNQHKSGAATTTPTNSLPLPLSPPGIGETVAVKFVYRLKYFYKGIDSCDSLLRLRRRGGMRFYENEKEMFLAT